MNNSLFWHLVVKDLKLYRNLIIGSILVGAVGVFLLTQGPVPFFVGATTSLCALLLLTIFLVQTGMVAERKSLVHYFVLSLPITGWQYTLAKLTAMTLALLLPWILLGGAALLLMALHPDAGGFIPLAVTVLMYFPLYFAVLFSAALARRRYEGLSVAVIIFFNIALNLFIPGLFRIPSVAATMNGPVAIWTPELLLVVAIEVGVGAAVLGLTLWYRRNNIEYL